MKVDYWGILKRNFAISQHCLFPNKTWQLLINFLWDLMNRRLKVQSMKYICSEKAILSQTPLSKILRTPPGPNQPLWFCVDLYHLNLSVKHQSNKKQKCVQIGLNNGLWIINDWFIYYLFWPGDSFDAWRIILFKQRLV